MGWGRVWYLERRSNFGQTLVNITGQTPVQNAASRAWAWAWDSRWEGGICAWLARGRERGLCRPNTDQYWSNTGQKLVTREGRGNLSGRGSSLCRPNVVKHWSNTGQILVKSLLNTGLLHPASAGHTQNRGIRAGSARVPRLVVKHWSNTGQTLVKYIGARLS
jgi:hypothetical protein